MPVKVSTVLSAFLGLAREIGLTSSHGSCEIQWNWRPTSACSLVVMSATGNPDLPRPPWLVWEVLGNGWLSNELVRDLCDWFRVTREDGGRSIQRSAPGEAFRHSLDTFPLGWTSPPGWSYSHCWGLTSTERYTSYTRFPPSWSSSIWQTCT